MVSPLLFHIGIIVASLAVVIKSADLLVYGITNYAKKLGVSDYLIGFIVVGIGTSLPELVSALMGNNFGDVGIVMGTIFGSGVFTLLFLLGMMGIVGKKVNMKSKLLEGREYLIPVIAALPLLLSLDGVLSRLDGVVLIAVYFGYISLLWKKEGTFGHLKKRVYFENIYKDALIFAGSLIALLLSARWLVFSSIELSKALNIPSFIIALTVIAIGASLPDLLVQIKALKTGHAKLGFGNILGSVVSQLMLIFGLIALMNPFNVPLGSVMFAGIAVFLASIISILITKKGYITRNNGLFLVGLYLLFIIIEII